MQHTSQVHSSIGPRQVRPMGMKKADSYRDLPLIGICGLDQNLNKMIEGIGIDAIQGLVTTASITTPIQFLQTWLPGFVNVITAARKIDELIGISTVGYWEDEEVVQGVMEQTGKAVPYGDYNNVPFASWNANWERRTVVRFEEGIRVGTLSEKRSARANINSAQQSREGATLALEIQRNAVGFYGFNSGSNRTYGFLNDPNLPAYVTVANPGSGTTWAVKTYEQICADIRTAVAALRVQSGDTISAYDIETTLAVATAAVDRLSTVSQYGNSVMDWIKATYPKMRVVSAPELSSANGGANVFYLYAERIQDTSTDDGRVFMQIVPSKFNLLGVQKTAKGYEEDYSNATAGTLLKRPFGVVRYTGI